MFRPKLKKTPSKNRVTHIYCIILLTQSSSLREISTKELFSVYKVVNYYPHHWLPSSAISKFTLHLGEHNVTDSSKVLCFIVEIVAGSSGIKCSIVQGINSTTHGLSLTSYSLSGRMYCIGNGQKLFLAENSEILFFAIS